MVFGAMLIGGMVGAAWLETGTNQWLWNKSNRNNYNKRKKNNSRRRKQNREHDCKLLKHRPKDFKDLKKIFFKNLKNWEI